MIAINRINKDRTERLDIEVLEITIDGEKYTLSENFGKLRILAREGHIAVYPCMANVLEIK